MVNGELYSFVGHQLNSPMLNVVIQIYRPINSKMMEMITNFLRITADLKNVYRLKWPMKWPKFNASRIT